MKWAQDDLQALLTRTTSTSPVSSPLHLFVREIPNCFCPDPLNALLPLLCPKQLEHLD